MVVVSVFGRVGEQWQDLCRRLCFLCVLWITSCPCGIMAAGEGVMSFSAAVGSRPEGLHVRKWGGGRIPFTARIRWLHPPSFASSHGSWVLLAVFHSVGSIPTTSGLPGKVQLCVNSELIGL